MIPVQLPVTAEVFTRCLQHTEDRCGLVVLQHLLPDTESFIYLCEGFGFTITAILGISYSARAEVVQRLSRRFDVRVPAFEGLTTTAESLLSDTYAMANERGQPFIVHEVGGYLADWAAAEPESSGPCLGIVEETKQGLWRYAKQARLGVPVLQIADSRLKSYEARHVGEAVALCFEEDLTFLGRRLSESRGLVLGFGDIGSAVAASLRVRGSPLGCFDLDPSKRIAAAMSGFRCGLREELIAESEVIVGAAGAESLHTEDLPRLKDGVLLASASSRNIEFPIDDLERLATSAVEISPFLREYQMPWGKAVLLANRGFPVNFRHMSLPAPFADLMFAQIAMCIGALTNSSFRATLHSFSPEDEQAIAQVWWDEYGHLLSVT